MIYTPFTFTSEDPREICTWINGELQRIAAAITPYETVIIPIIAEGTAITTGSSKRIFRIPYAFQLYDVQGVVITAQTSGTAISIDVHSGELLTSILSTKITIDNGEKSSVTAATPPVLNVTRFQAHTQFSVNIDTIGDGTAKGLYVHFLGLRLT